jgi:hypothetical protein
MRPGKQQLAISQSKELLTTRDAKNTKGLQQSRKKALTGPF